MIGDRDEGEELMNRILKGEKITSKDTESNNNSGALKTVNEGANIWNYELSESKKTKKGSKLN